MQGFVELNNKMFTVVDLPRTKVPLEYLQREFVVEFHTNDKDSRNHFLVNVESISHPLFVFDDHGGDADRHWCVLPERKWGRYFGEIITKK